MERCMRPSFLRPACARPVRLAPRRALHTAGDIYIHCHAAIENGTAQLVCRPALDLTEGLHTLEALVVVFLAGYALTQLTPRR